VLAPQFQLGDGVITGIDRMQRNNELLLKVHHHAAAFIQQALCVAKLLL
jgi:hypothetical protein